MQDDARRDSDSGAGRSEGDAGVGSRTAGAPSDAAGNDFLLAAPALSLPKGGGAMRGIGEKFAANPVTGTGSMTIPIALSPGRGGFGPQLALAYDSGAGQSVFGLGWNLALPSITRKTDKGLPRYLDAEASDEFLLAGAEDLVPETDPATGRQASARIALAGTDYDVRRYRPRIEGLFARIECWTVAGSPDAAFWRTISRDNVTTWYGRDAESRIADPDDPAHVFQWLICQTSDDKGNVAVYRYIDDTALAIDATTPWEANRGAGARAANRYLKRIQYGNPPPSWLPRLDPVEPDVLPSAWMFEAVLDYGDHAGEFPAPTPDDPPAPDADIARADAFSTHRAGFEIRTHRLCRRVLMFHNFPGVAGVGAGCLVRSTNFDYQRAVTTGDAGAPSYTTLRSATQWSFRATPDDAAAPYVARQLPPVIFRYSEPRVGGVAQAIASSELENLPVGTQGPGYRWIDLDGEGLSGVLAETPGAWYYKRGLGDGRFGPAREVARLPALASAASGRHQFIDLAGSGAIDVVDFSGPAPGFHERDADDGWKRHVPFASLPNVDWQDPNLRFVDLTGDGHADVLVTEQDVFTWYASLDVRGFAAAVGTRQPADDDSGPRLVFADGTQTIFLADMCGDGLTDLVRIRNGQVCYWPNLGYGRFGRKVTLGNAPRFDAPDLFDPARLRLADIDGSGTVDLLYLGRAGAQLYFNRSGNHLSDALVVDLPVATENLAAVQVVDLLGNGTACLVWNSHLPADQGTPVRFIDLMGGTPSTAADQARQRRHEKPHLLICVDNNLGVTTDIEYTPSTRFYLQDRAAGTPWATRLPFPVHCVSQVTVRDKWRGTAFSSSYSYHHGVFDGAEREFRGFGRVEQLDTQAFADVAAANAGSPYVTPDGTLYQPPVKTITWFHTGIARDRERILGLYAHEYLPARFAAQFAAAGFAEPAIPEPVVDAGPGGVLSDAEWREALRACKGMALRQEVHELDQQALSASGAQVSVKVFWATQHGCRITRLQPREDNRHAVFLVTQAESFTCGYELDLRPAALVVDPRVAQSFNLRFDAYGRPLQAVSVAYPRRLAFSDPNLDDDQVALIDGLQRGERHLGYVESRFTDELPFDAHQHRLPLPCELRTYELTGANTATGFVPASGPWFTAADLLAFHLSDTPPGQGARPVGSTEYHLQPADDSARKRLVEHARTLWLAAPADAPRPSVPLPFGKHDARALKYEDYKLALTDSLLAAVFETRLQDEVDPAVTAADVLADRAQSGYVPGTAIDDTLAGQYWMCSGVAGFGSDVAYDARNAFWLPVEYRDAFDNLTTVDHDAARLFVQRSTDALGNVAEVLEFDYRVLAPARLRDANFNESAVVFDAFGLPVASAVLGKVVPATAATPESTESGDTLAGFGSAQLDPLPADVASFFDAQGLDGRESAWLGKATARFVHHFGEQRDATGAVVAWAARPAASCSLMRELHERDRPGGPGIDIPLQVGLEYSDGAGQAFVKKVQAEPETPGGPVRWIANGKTIVNNKGKPVLQYEPYFSADDLGMPDRRFQEPQARGVSPVMFYDAAGRLVRTEFADGTVSRIEFSPWFSRSFDQNDTVLEAGNRWYARRTAAGASADDRRAGALAALHAGTPSESHLDSLGRAVVAIAHNRTPEAGNGTTPLPQRQWLDARTLTLTRLDAEGKPLWIRDARGNLVVQYVRRAAPTAGGTINQVEPTAWVPCYDIAGNLLFQHGMDSGDRWTLGDAAGRPLLSWDRNEFRDSAGSASQHRVFRTRHDALHRPIEQWLTTSNDAGTVTGRFRLELFEHVDTATVAPADLAATRSRNLIGQAVRHWDPSGCATVERVDLGGQPAHLTRTLLAVDPARDDDPALDWPATQADRAALLDADTFIQITERDALGRTTRLYHWHRDITFDANGTPHATPGATNRVAIYVPRYDARGLLAGETIHVRATKSTVGGLPQADVANARSNEAIKAITRDAKGQKLGLRLGNDTLTTFTYDPASLRLVTLKTTRPVAPAGVQDLRYTFDAAGNVTNLQDAAQETVWSNNARIDASHDYTYDALYRLIEATGRENTPAPPPMRDGPWPAINFPTGDIPRKYTQRYAYDEAGNFLLLQQLADAGNGFTRRYQPRPDSNQLWRTWVGAPDWDSASLDQRVEYWQDTHGNQLNLNRTATPPALRDEENFGLAMRWDWRDMIAGIDLVGGGIARYQYDGVKQRTRKKIARRGGVSEDRLYLGDYELYRRHDAQGDVVEEIESLHLSDGQGRVLLVDDVFSTDANRPDGLAIATRTLFRFQYGNSLDSVSMELDDAALTIAYEEFHPFGTSAFAMRDTAMKAPPRRYRYAGMERDEETGLSCHGARCLCPWLGVWISADPAGVKSGLNVYVYANQNPLKFVDRNGRDPVVIPKNGLDPAQRSALITALVEKSGLTSEQVTSLGIQDDNGLTDAYEQHVVGDVFSTETRTATTQFIFANRETKLGWLSRKAGEGLEWLSSTRVGRSASAAKASVEENVDVQVKAFDRGAGDVGYGMVGGDKGDANQVRSDVQRQQYTNAQNVVGPSLRAGGGAMVATAMAVSDVRGAIELTDLVYMGATRGGMNALRGAAYHELGYEFEAVAKETLRERLSGTRLIDYLDDSGEVVLKRKLVAGGIDKVTAIPEAVLYHPDGSGLLAIYDAKIGGISAEQGIVYIDNLVAANGGAATGRLIYLSPDGVRAIPRALQEYADSKGVEIIQRAIPWSAEFPTR